MGKKRVISLRLEPETIREIEEISKALGMSKSQVIREALRFYMLHSHVLKTKEVLLRV